MSSTTSAATNIFSGFSAYKAGQAERRAATLEARAADREAEVAHLQGVEAQTDIREELEGVFSTLSVLSAGGSVAAASPTLIAYQAQQRREATRNERSALLSSDLREYQARTRAAAARQGRRASGLTAAARSLSFFAQAGRDLSNTIPVPGGS